LSIYFRT